MSVALSPVRQRTDHASPDVAEICRARHVVERLGGRFSLELGIDLDSGPPEVERWALAVTLLGDEILWSVATHTFQALEHAGIRTIADAGRCEREELARLLDEGGYDQQDGWMASRLLALAEVVADRYRGRLATLGVRVVDPQELLQALGALPGWSPATARAFLRELRGIWPGAELPLDPHAALAARHVALPVEPHAFRSVAAAAHVDFRDLEAGLVRLARSHDLGRCAGGEECPLAACEHEDFVHF